jgi:transposase
MARVIIGMDPHKRSVTIEVLDGHENVLLVQRFATDRDGFRELLRTGRGFADRIWAVEGCSGIGRHVAQRLVAAGESVVDVPPKLSGRTVAVSDAACQSPDRHACAVWTLKSSPSSLSVIQMASAWLPCRMLVRAG